MEGQWEAIIHARKQRRISYELGCGGQHFIRIQKHIIGHVMHVK